jgi:hypothetical protein
MQSVFAFTLNSQTEMDRVFPIKAILDFNPYSIPELEHCMHARKLGYINLSSLLG